MLTRRGFLSSLPLLPAAAQSARPNLVVIYTDDQGIGDLGCYGASEMRTPHLDRLAASGIRFTDWYSNCPVCSPSRAALLTGQYPQRTGIVNVLESSAAFSTPGLREGERTLPGLLRQAGYRTAAVGKWHLGSARHSRPMAQGFDEFFGFYSGWTDALSHRYYVQAKPPGQIFHDLWRGEQEAWEDPRYMTEVLTREGRAFLEKQRAGQPFFLYLAYGAPHYPMIAPKQYLDRFPASMDPERRMHAAMIAAIDDGVGEIVGALERQGLRRDTLVFFQSDNGATREERASPVAKPYRGGSNRPFRGYKAGLFEGGIRMPALLSFPGRIKAGQVVGEVGAAMDIAPTFLSMAGLGTRAAGMDGADLSGMLTRAEKSPHTAIFWGYGKQKAVRAGEWKLIENPPQFPGEPVSEPVWLSNLAQDPGETRNLAAAEPGRVARLKAMLAGWEKRVGG